MLWATVDEYGRLLTSSPALYANISAYNQGMKTEQLFIFKRLYPSNNIYVFLIPFHANRAF